MSEESESEREDSSLDSAEQPVDDIELAYREAMSALDDAEVQVGNALMDVADDDDGALETSEQAFVSIGQDLAQDLQLDDGCLSIEEVAEERISPREVIEAALFVGGDVALTTRRLAALIGSGVESSVAAKVIDQLNQDYARDNRPYQVQLQEGGFRLQLREHFARLQSQVYGTGPKEIRLVPDVIEILAFVAWNQPVDASDLTETGHDKPMTSIRQLIRLQLLEVERTGSHRTDVAYRTSQRFLELFNLKSLEDLPQADIFAFK